MSRGHHRGLGLGALAGATLGIAAALVVGCGGDDGKINQAPTGASSSSGAGGAGGGAGAGGHGGSTVPGEIQGCAADVKLLENPADPSMRGPSPVGAKTVVISGLSAEVWYPAPIGSDAGKPTVVYDLRTWLPDSEKGKIPDADNPWQDGTSYRDLPIDDAHGPYPVVVFLHGTAGFRTQSLAQMEHWASRGFVVVAADYPGLYLGDLLNFMFSADLPGDTTKIVTALAPPAGDLAFLAGHIDTTRIGMAGHSAGGGGIKGFGNTPGVRVLMPLASGGVDPGSALESTLVMGGVNDSVVNYTQQVMGYDSSPKKKRLVGVSNTGHLFPSELCWLVNSSGKNIVEVAQQYMIKNAQFASGLFDCPAGQISRETAVSIVNYATTAVLEETLRCAKGDPFASIQATYPDISEYRQDL